MGKRESRLCQDVHLIKRFKSATVKLVIEERFSVKGSALFDAHYELKKLEQENRYLREEPELLKKFQVFLKPNKKSNFSS